MAIVPKITVVVRPTIQAKSVRIISVQIFFGVWTIF